MAEGAHHRVLTSSLCLHSRGAVHCLWWLWWCQRSRQWLRREWRKWLLLRQRSQPWRWLQFWQWQSHRVWLRLLWGQQFHHQIHHHHLLLQQEGLQALKSCHGLKLPQCLRLPLQLHHPLLQLFPLSAPFGFVAFPGSLRQPFWPPSSWGTFRMSPISVGPWKPLKTTPLFQTVNGVSESLVSFSWYEL